MPALIAAASSGVGMIVPGLSFGIVFHLSWVGLAQADNTHSVNAKAKHHHMQTVADLARRLEAGFGILLARVFMYYGRFPFKILGIRQRQTVLFKVAIVFGQVKFVVHENYCINIK